MMKPHALSELLPAMSAAEQRSLTADIKEHGLHQPITLYEGQILDGRHRYIACNEAGVIPRFDNFKGDDAAAGAFVFSQNLTRRQLTKTQLALAGAKLKEWQAIKAKERQMATLKKGSAAPVVENLPPRENGKARDQAAKQVGVSGKMIDEVERVMKKVVPEIAKRLERGEMALNEAAKLAELPKETQRRIASQPTRRLRAVDLNAAMKRSTAGKKNHSQIVQAADAPGTQIVRTLLSRLELLTNEIERSGLTPQKFAELFLTEFDWSEPLLVRRLNYVGNAIEMIASLSVMSQRARASRRA